MSGTFLNAGNVVTEQICADLVGQLDSDIGHDCILQCLASSVEIDSLDFSCAWHDQDKDLETTFSMKECNSIIYLRTG